jgi:hypothetical protein
MKRKLLHFFFFLAILILIMEYIILPYITPGVTLVNKTDKEIFVRRAQFAIGDNDPAHTEVLDLKKLWAIGAGEERYFPISFYSLVSSRVRRFSIGGMIGDQSNFSASVGHEFDVNRDYGICRAKIEIYEDYYKLFPTKSFYCYKKLLSLVGRMSIHTEEKTRTNVYGPNVDKIEKQVIRLNDSE